MSSNLKSELENILKLVVDWLKFAEAKNAALLTLNSAALFGVYRIVVFKEDLDTWVRAYLICTGLLLLVSGAICLMSFFARLRTRYLFPTPNKPQSPNLYFFEHIAGFSDQQYLADLANVIGVPTPKNNSPEYMIANQVVINARIGARKFKLFNMALWVTLSALLTPLGALFVWMLHSDL